MTKYVLAFAFLALSPSIVKANEYIKQTSTMKETSKNQQSIYQFKVNDLYGNEFDFASLKGKKILIVNTASECGLTPQYEQLQSLYEEFGGDNFVIIGFPANNFGNQEPGSNEQIATFCKANFGVTFPMMDKVSVKGEDMAPIYKFLTQKSLNGFADSNVEWNFQKYLIDEKGHVVQVINPRILPNDPEIKEWIKKK
ncbi:glutathione peroxidase [Myroides odoratus]|uniref:glutathione peroxidase n=1 Tax=Myroides odoratus TaxID=256 RepID=UPI0039B01CE4